MTPQEFINDLLSQGFDYVQIAYSVCDVEYLEKISITQEFAEEVYSICRYESMKPQTLHDNGKFGDQKCVLIKDNNNFFMITNGNRVEIGLESDTEDLESAAIDLCIDLEKLKELLDN